MAATLQYTFLDAAGNPMDLTPTADVSESASDSDSAAAPDVAVLLKVREFTGYRDDATQCWTVEGTLTDPANGVARAALPAQVYNQCGIYEAHWALVVDNARKLIRTSALSVERTLFGADVDGQVRTEGPPTLGEVRMMLMDNPGDNKLLMGEVEFDDDQLLQALAWPVRYFNEQPPPLHVRYTTRNFPWRAMWMDGVRAILYSMSSAWLTRQRLPITGGGKTVDPYVRADAYKQAAVEYRQRWEDAVLRKRIEINTVNGVASLGSAYGGFGW